MRGSAEQLAAGEEVGRGREREREREKEDKEVEVATEQRREGREAQQLFYEIARAIYIPIFQFTFIEKSIAAKNGPSKLMRRNSVAI